MTELIVGLAVGLLAFLQNRLDAGSEQRDRQVAASELTLIEKAHSLGLTTTADNVAASLTRRTSRWKNTSASWYPTSRWVERLIYICMLLFVLLLLEIGVLDFAAGYPAVTNWASKNRPLLEDLQTLTARLLVVSLILVIVQMLLTVGRWLLSRKQDAAYDKPVQAVAPPAPPPPARLVAPVPSLKRFAVAVLLARLLR